MERHWKREIKKVKDTLGKLTENRTRQMEHRKHAGLKTVSIVGYTNAGKTSLFNLLTHKKNLVENILFATLDSTVGEVFILQLHKQIVVSDTIGFISNLPPDLIEAFTSTLLESVHADIVLHVVDGSDHDITEKINVVNSILDQLHIPKERQLLVFNKGDAIKEFDRKRIAQYTNDVPFIFISTKTREGIDALLTEVSRLFLNER